MEKNYELNKGRKMAEREKIGKIYETSKQAKKRNGEKII